MADKAYCHVKESLINSGFPRIRNILILLILSFTVTARGAEVCLVEPPYIEEATCSADDNVVVKNDQALDAYLVNYGYDGSQYKNLKIAYDITRENILIHSPCTIKLKKDVTLTGNSICLNGRKGVENGKGSHVNAGEVYIVSSEGKAGLGQGSIVHANSLNIIAKEKAKIGQNNQITLTGDLTLTSSEDRAVIKQGSIVSANNVTIQASEKAKIGQNVNLVLSGNLLLTSTEDLLESTARINQGSTVQAVNVSLVSIRKSVIGKNVTLNTSGILSLKSTGVESKTKVRQGSSISALIMRMTSASTAKLAKDTQINVVGNFHMDGTDKCVIAENATINTGSETGNCFGVAEDTQAPVITVTEPSDGFITSSENIVLSGQVNEQVLSFTINGNEILLNNLYFSQNITLQTGLNTINFEAMDFSGNKAFTTHSIYLDQVAPIIIISSHNDGDWVMIEPIPLTGSVNEKLSSLTINGTNVSVNLDGTFSVNLSLNEGGNLISIEAIDLAGNFSSFNLSINLDTTVPTLSINPSGGIIQDALTPFTVNYQDSGSGIDLNSITIVLNGSNITSLFTKNENQAQYTPSDPIENGEHSWNVSVSDIAGNENTTGAPFTIATEPAPEAIWILGDLDGKDDEFQQQDYNAEVDLDIMQVSEFPQEINLAWWPETIFDFTLSYDESETDLMMVFQVAWQDGNGSLIVQLEASIDSEWVNIGTTQISSQKNGVILINSNQLMSGQNRFRIKALSGIEGTTVVTWDQIALRHTNSGSSELTINDALEAVVNNYATFQHLEARGVITTEYEGNTFIEPEYIIYLANRTGTERIDLYATEAYQNVIESNILIDHLLQIIFLNGQHMTVDLAEEAGLNVEEAKPVSLYFDVDAFKNKHNIVILPDAYEGQRVGLRAVPHENSFAYDYIDLIVNVNKGIIEQFEFYKGDSFIKRIEVKESVFKNAQIWLPRKLEKTLLTEEGQWLKATLTFSGLQVNHDLDPTVFDFEE